MVSGKRVPGFHEIPMPCNLPLTVHCIVLRVCAYFLLAKFSCIIPPMVPSALKFFPTAPCLSKGPPMDWAVPPMGPSARSTMYQPMPTHPDLTHSTSHSYSPLNIFPIVPSFENIDVPVPVVLSPDPGYQLMSTAQ